MHPPLDGVVVITGASSGIGRELARLAAPEAKKLILVARRKERLDELAEELKEQCEVDVRPCDLSDLEQTRKLADDLGEVDVLINNAGLGNIGMYESSDWDAIVRMNRVNIDALMLLTHAVLPSMVARGSGGILFISSGFGLTFMPVMSAYVATKHYVTSFAESLRIELAGTGVVISQVCPGPVETEFEDVAGNPFGRSPPKLVVITPKHCARAALAGFRRRRAMTVPGLIMKIVILAGRMTPRLVLRLLYGPLARQARRLLASDPPESYQQST